jgi:hypothetical protein
VGGGEGVVVGKSGVCVGGGAEVLIGVIVLVVTLLVSVKIKVSDNISLVAPFSWFCEVVGDVHPIIMIANQIIHERLASRFRCAKKP